MRNYLLLLPIFLAGYALIIDVYYLFTYKQAVFGELNGAGAAQWQIVYTYYHWPIVSSLVALIIAILVNKKYLKVYLTAFLILSITPFVLFLLVKNGHY
jgi:uncharacterized membrane protein